MSPPPASPSLLPVAEAQRRLLAAARLVASEIVPITEALGRWAVEPVVARRTQPSADLSAMDGYAIRFADLPGPWRVIGESAAGRPFARAIGAGEATRIFTGAALPAGADAVLIQEEAEREGDRLMLAGEGPTSPTRNVRRRGLDFSEGQELVAAGERLTAARLAVAATAGVAEARVARRVRVGIASTGDELVEIGQPIPDGHLPESNRLLLRSLLADLPVEVIDLGILMDDLDDIRDAFASTRCDLLLTTGGASVGDHDLVRPALEAAGAAIDFWRIALRPGKPMMAGRLGDAQVLGLPGNPVSAFVTAILFARPLVAALSGARDAMPRTTAGILGEDLPANGPRTDYLRAELRDGRLYAAAIQDSSMLLTLARANCLIVRAPHAPPASAGDSAEILMIA